MSVKRFSHVPVGPASLAVARNGAVCTDCGNCVAVCAESIGPAKRWIQGGYFSCVSCGQCIAACPEQALTVKSQLDLVKAAVDDPEKIVIFSTSPAVRVGLGDAFGYSPGSFVEGKMVHALRLLGGDYVFDVTFGADLTIMEECTEFLYRVLAGKGPLPQFTSCCPAWVKYAETFLPQLLPHLSTAKSPISMQGATIKTYFAKLKGMDPKKIVSVAVTPCVAKKMEINRPELADAAAELGIPELRDNDYVITTKELAQWLQERNIAFETIAEGDFDHILGRGSGAGVIFGSTGGVMEAALRMAYATLTGKEPDELLLQYEPVRGLTDFKGATVTIGDKSIRVAVLYGTENVAAHLEELLREYHFVEVMTCPGGCISGAGQPEGTILPVADALRQARMDSLYAADAATPMKTCLDNPDITAVYKQFYGQPLSEKSERLLHTVYADRSK